MTAAAKKLLAQVLALPDEDRNEVLVGLARAVPEEALSASEWDEVWAVEINRRIEEMDSGKVKMVSHAEHRRRIDRILRRAA